MDKGIRAGRDDTAQKRIVTAAEALGEKFNLGAQVAALKGADAKDREIKVMLQREALADLLEALALALATGAADVSVEPAGGPELVLDHPGGNLAGVESHTSTAENETLDAPHEQGSKRSARKK